MTDTFDKSSVSKAFEIIAEDVIGGHSHFEFNGYTFNVGDPQAEEVLAVVVMSHLGHRLEQIRDMLNAALGPMPTPEKWSGDEVSEARAILNKHLESGYIAEVTTQNEKVYIAFPE
jgi:hypothetical protein